MLHSNHVLQLSVTLTFFVFVQTFAFSQERSPTKTSHELEHYRAPTGRLSDRLGELITIEGMLPADAKAKKGGTTSLRVDTVDGVKLKEPRGIDITGFQIPPNRRCVLKGYETGSMIGTPPAVLEAAKELGREPPGVSQAAYQWYTHFVVLIVVEPKQSQIPLPIAEP